MSKVPAFHKVHLPPGSLWSMCDLLEHALCELGCSARLLEESQATLAVKLAGDQLFQVFSTNAAAEHIYLIVLVHPEYSKNQDFECSGQVGLPHTIGYGHPES